MAGRERTDDSAAAEPAVAEPGNGRERSTGERFADVLPFPSLGRRPVPTEAAEHEPRLREIIGQVLRDERHDQGRTLADIAEHAAVSLPYLSEVERGRKEVSSDLLAAISVALELSLPEILERSAERIRIGSTGSGIQLLAA